MIQIIKTRFALYKSEFALLKSGIEAMKFFIKYAKKAMDLLGDLNK